MSFVLHGWVCGGYQQCRTGVDHSVSLLRRTIVSSAARFFVKNGLRSGLGRRTGRSSHKQSGKCPDNNDNNPYVRGKILRGARRVLKNVARQTSVARNNNSDDPKVAPA